MRMTALEYLAQLQGLLPPGTAWPTTGDATLTQLLGAIAEELARIDARAERLADEAFPLNCYETLSDWERAYGLPTACMAGISQTQDQRRAALIARILDKGGQRPADYVALAAAVGFTVTVTEFRPHTVEDPVDIPILGDDWAYAFQINAPETTVTYFEVDDGVDEPLASWGNALLECVIRYKSPAHTIPIFAYS